MDVDGAPMRLMESKGILGNREGREICKNGVNAESLKKLLGFGWQVLPINT